MILRALLAIFTALLLAGHADAATHYIRDGGTASTSGTGSCTGWATANACDQLPSTLVRGDTYCVADGVYGGQTFSTATSGTTVITIRKAVHGDGVCDQGPDWVSTYGDGQATFTNWSFTTSYWLVDGVVGGGPSSWESGHGFVVFSTSSILMTSASGTTNITIKHTHFDSDRGVTFIAGFKNVNGFSDHTFSYCAFTDIFGPPFHIGTATNLTIEYSYIARNKNTAAEHSEGISSIGTNTNVVIRWNIWDQIEGTAVWAGVNVGSSVGWKIYGNIIARSVTPIYYYWEVPGTNQNSMTDSVIANNTIVGTPGVSQGAFVIQQGSGNVAYNNLWYDNDANAFGQSPTHDYSFASENIRSDGGPIDMDSDIVSGEANGQTSTGSPFVSYNADPKLADLSATTNSGFDTGAILPGNDVDMLGNTRGVGGWTRGAIQQVSGSPPDAPTNFRLTVDLWLTIALLGLMGGAIWRAMNAPDSSRGGRRNRPASAVRAGQVAG